MNLANHSYQQCATCGEDRAWWNLNHVHTIWQEPVCDTCVHRLGAIA